MRGGVSVRVCAWRGVSEGVLVHSVDWCVATVRAQRCHVPVMFLSYPCHVPVVFLSCSCHVPVVFLSCSSISQAAKLD